MRALRSAKVVGTTTSSLGFGAASLYANPRKADRFRLIRRAVELGIRHFDVAPMYGLGLAERELGAALGSDRDKVTVATKFGIDMRAWARALAPAQRPARTLLSALPSGKHADVTGSALYRRVGFDAGAARRSLESSLRRLGTDRVDLLLMHDPSPDDATFDGVCEFLDDASRASLIRGWGIANDLPQAVSVAETVPCDPDVLQFRWNVFHATEIDRGASVITYGVLRPSLRHIWSVLQSNDALRRKWGSRLDVDIDRPSRLATVLVEDALYRNPEGITLYSTSSIRHLETVVTAADLPCDDGRCDQLHALLREPPFGASER